MPVTYRDILAARERIGDRIDFSPCPASLPLSELTGMSVYCKLDNLQRTGSFKERGAANALRKLTPEQRRQGVIAASAGNHALGLAYQGKLLDIPVTVVMPRFAPLIKQTTCRQLGATVILAGESLADAKAKADELAAERGLIMIHGFDNPDIIAGQGTLGLEVVEQVPDLDAIIVPVGGAGLLAGVGLAIKTLRPSAMVIAVEPERAASLTAAIKAGHPVKVPVLPTLADGLAVEQVGALSFETARRHVDRVVTLTEDELALAVLRTLELEKTVVEGAGAAPLAAVLAKKVPELAGKKVVLPFSGGNIDPAILDRVIEKGLVADGRICRFTAVISDRPGGLAKFCSLIATTGASVKDIAHDRAFAGGDVSATNLVCVLETSGRDHIEQIHELLRREGVTFQAWTRP
jgi:threonine dehydratase